MKDFKPATDKRGYTKEKQNQPVHKTHGRSIRWLLNNGYKYYCQYCEVAQKEFKGGYCNNCQKRWQKKRELYDIRSGELVNKT